jgi:predicted DCC family thiol-disulfide oxidoreductase YuxK
VVKVRAIAAPARYTYRQDPSVPAFPDDKPIIVFDGLCVLCSGFARFTLKTDRRGRYRLLAAQSPLGVALYGHYDLRNADYDSNILLENGQIWLKSEGSIRMFQGLGFPWSLAGLARLLPLPIRDKLYDWVARNRLRWFGRREACFVPDPAHADRVLG